jgi:hypothetical protein
MQKPAKRRAHEKTRLAAGFLLASHTRQAGVPNTGD